MIDFSGYLNFWFFQGQTKLGMPANNLSCIWKHSKNCASDQLRKNVHILEIVGKGCDIHSKETCWQLPKVHPAKHDINISAQQQKCLFCFATGPTKGLHNLGGNFIALLQHKSASKDNKIMLTKLRLPAKIMCHMYNNCDWYPAHFS